MVYRDYNDYELLDYIAENNQEAIEIIYQKYRPLIYGIAKRMLKHNKNLGLELNDLVQEGMLALSKAIDTFDESDDAAFYTYAKTCIERQIISVIISNKRLKRKALNDSLSIEATYTLGDINDIEYLFKSDEVNPENILISEEKTSDLISVATDLLTDFEMQVFELKINNFSYVEIAQILDRDVKAIDNAMQRIRNKLKNNVNLST